MKRSALETRVALVLSLAFAVSCALPGGPRGSRVDVTENGGFTVKESAPVDGDARRDFEEGLRLVEAGELEDGIAHLERAAEAAPDATAIHIDLGIAHRMAGDPAKADASFERALALSPRHPVALNERGIALRRMGRFDDARDHYEKALRVAPAFHFAQRNLAILCDVYLGDLSCALEHYEAIARLEPDDRDVAMWIVDVSRRLAAQGVDVPKSDAAPDEEEE